MSLQHHLLDTYRRLPVSPVRGEGVWLWDEAGNKYLDALAGIAVCGLGHAHPKLTQAIQAQAESLLHCSNLYRIPQQETLAARLCKLSDMDGVFFGNSGAEANEAAIKLARLHAYNRGIKNPLIAVMEGAFHGRTLNTLAATASAAAREGFEPLPPGFLRLPFGDIEALRQAASQHDNIVAVLTEPIQGEAGILIPPAGYLQNLRRLCDVNDWLLMLDEIQTGMGRTGEWFAYQYEDIQPDVLSLAKGLGGGVPIGACLARGEAASVFKPGKHGSTFGGNPLACAAALALIEGIEEGQLLANTRRMGELLADMLRQGLDDVMGVVEIRQRGLMLAVELERPCTELVPAALAQGLLINVTAQSVVRLLPPLLLSEDEARQIADILTPLILTHLQAGEEAAG